ncbi:hypothetical protein CerSpe_068570 [Prunus speciosa]
MLEISGICKLVSLLTYTGGNTKDDLRLPPDENLLSQVRPKETVLIMSQVFTCPDGFAEGKDLVVTVMASMGEEQICALKDIGPNNY